MDDSEKGERYKQELEKSETEELADNPDVP